MTSSSNVLFVSSIIAVSEPFIGQADRREELRRDRLLLGRHPLEAERLGQPPRRVDRQAEDAPPSRRRGHAERRGRRRLADAARPDRHEHPTRHDELIERFGHAGTACAESSSHGLSAR